MADLRARLIDCFGAVFSNLERDAIPRATTETLERWDSLATVTLVAVVQEEFGVEVEPEDFPSFTSFDGVLGYLRKTIPAS